MNAIRKPLSAIAKKANRQIRETKVALGLTDWKGVLVCVNDNFRMATPKIIEGLLGRILNGSMSSVDATIYITNHYVEFPNIPYATLVWSPSYRDSGDEQLVDFVNWLGEKWGEYSEKVLGPFDVLIGTDELTLDNVVPVSGPGRTYPVTGHSSANLLLNAAATKTTASGLIIPIHRQPAPNDSDEGALRS